MHVSNNINDHALQPIGTRVQYPFTLSKRNIPDIRHHVCVISRLRDARLGDWMVTFVWYYLTYTTTISLLPANRKLCAKPLQSAFINWNISHRPPDFSGVLQSLLWKIARPSPGHIPYKRLNDWPASILAYSTKTNSYILASHFGICRETYCLHAMLVLLREIPCEDVFRGEL